MIGRTGAQPAFVKRYVTRGSLPPRATHGPAAISGAGPGGVTGTGGDADGQDILEGPPSLGEEAMDMSGEGFRVASACGEEDVEELLAVEGGEVQIAGPGHV